MATTHDGFARLVEGVGGRPEVAALELNVSCPNVESGLIVGERPDETFALLEAVRPLTDLPLVVKLTPNVASPAEIARAAEAAGASAVSLINTLKAHAAAPRSGGAWMGGGGGGLSGAAVRAVALAQTRDVAGAVAVPVIGMGGVESGAHALDLIDAGAAAVAVGTASFRDPLAGERVRAELSAALASRGGRPSRGADRPRSGPLASTST
jgi:dihydroorotate dehydrogenase (NAD+) catalytic subunit